MAAKRAQESHGDARTPLYKVWVCMKQRCHNENYPGYRDYGARGIEVCPEWRQSFTAFRSWALANGYGEGLSIDRYPDNDGHYEPANCRWIPRGENSARNRRNRNYSAFGETKSVSDWSRDPRCAVNLNTLNGRIRRGWEFFAALTTVPDKEQDEQGRFARRETTRTDSYVPYRKSN